MGYLRKYPKWGYIINQEKPTFHSSFDSQPISIVEDFGHQYSYFKDEIDSQFLDPFLPKLEINMFADSDHGHDKVSGWSITGILCMVGSTPVLS